MFMFRFQTKLHVDILPHFKPYVSKSDQTSSPPQVILDRDFDAFCILAVDIEVVSSR